MAQDYRRYLSPLSKRYIVELLRGRADELRERVKGTTDPELWHKIRDLESAANDLEDS